MATHKLLLLPGDGIGPEVMAEVQRVIDWLNAQGIAKFETEQGLVGGSAYDAHKGVDLRGRHGQGDGGGRRDLRRGRRPEVGQRAL
ncbi:isocitrate/isopropylmalate dehydrogenase [Bradyrhizobium elkanii]